MELSTPLEIMEEIWTPTIPDFFTGVSYYDPTSTPSLWNATDIDLLNSTLMDIYANVTNSSSADPGPRKSSVSKYYPIITLAMMLSIVALSLSIAVYATLPEFRNVHGKNLVCVSGCLLTTYLLLSADLALRGVLPRPTCFAIGMIIQVTFLGTFFWTNVMAFDIWRSLTVMRHRQAGSSNKNKFRRYAAYAWSATVLTALPAALLELTEWVPAQYRPKFGDGRCWLNGIFAFLHYFNMPVGFVLLSNLVMFVLTLRKLAAIKKMTAILNVEQQQERFRLYTKLFMVMGITWTSEYLPWMTGIHSLYAIAGTLTALHGCFLFLIFVCKKRILMLFYEKVILKKDISSSQNSGNSSGQQTGSSSTSHKKSIDLAVIKA